MKNGRKLPYCVHSWRWVYTALGLYTMTLWKDEWTKIGAYCLIQSYEIIYVALKKWHLFKNWWMKSYWKWSKKFYIKDLVKFGNLSKRMRKIRLLNIKGQLNSEWIYEVIISHKISTKNHAAKNYWDFCPGDQHGAEL